MGFILVFTNQIQNSGGRFEKYFVFTFHFGFHFGFYKSDTKFCRWVWGIFCCPSIRKWKVKVEIKMKTSDNLSVKFLVNPPRRGGSLPLWGRGREVFMKIGWNFSVLGLRNILYSLFILVFILVFTNRIQNSGMGLIKILLPTWTFWFDIGFDNGFDNGLEEFIGPPSLQRRDELFPRRGCAWFSMDNFNNQFQKPMDTWMRGSGRGSGSGSGCGFYNLVSIYIYIPIIPIIPHEFRKSNQSIENQL